MMWPKPQGWVHTEYCIGNICDDYPLYPYPPDELGLTTQLLCLPKAKGKASNGPLDQNIGLGRKIPSKCVVSDWPSDRIS